MELASAGLMLCSWTKPLGYGLFAILIGKGVRINPDGIGTASGVVGASVALMAISLCFREIVMTGGVTKDKLS